MEATGPSDELSRARAQLAEVKRDPLKRRYRHRWERAIAALEKAARGRDAGPALLDAARARYALYRFSQVESDRAAALALARKAEREGAREATLLRVAIRREMGDTGSGPAPDRRSGKAVANVSPPKQGSENRPAPKEGRKDGAGARRGAEALAAKGPRKGEGAPPAGAPRSPATSAALPPPSTGAERTAPAASPRGGADEEPPMEAVLERALASEDPSAGGAAAAEAEARVADLKTWSNHDYTRVAVYLSRSASVERVDLPGGDGQRRVAFDLRPARLARALVRDVGDTLVKSVHAEQLDGSTVRLVLDLAGEQELTVFPLDEPARLIVDVGAARPAPPVAAASPAPSRDEAPAPPPAPERRAGTSGAAPEERGARGPLRRVIVDAGHGGHDTGAIGPTNVREKDVTLAIAKRLEKRLRARGYEVVLTRTDDRYVALEERTAIANARHGDLFISVHANAHPRNDRRGVETYILNVTSDRYAARLAARENGALDEGAADIPVLRRILSDLEAKVSVEASRRVAVAVQRELCAGIRSRVGDVRDLGVKSALFHVLLGARMPAVLVETAFISNRVEERRLASSAFQDEVANALARAVESVSSAEARVATAP